MTHEHDDDIVCIARATTSTQAHMMQNALEEEGIHCRVVGDMLDAGIGDVPGLQAEIWVYRKDAERAAAVLQHAEPGTDLPDEEDEEEEEE